MRYSDYDAITVCPNGVSTFELVDAWWKACCRTYDNLRKLGFNDDRATRLALGDD